MQQTMNMELVNNIYREILGTCDIFDILLNTYKRVRIKRKVRYYSSYISNTGLVQTLF